MMFQSLLTVEEIAARWQVKVSFIERLVSKGILTSSERNKKYFNTRDLESAIAYLTVWPKRPPREKREKVTGFNFQKRAILYYLRIRSPEGWLYKIGITNRTVKSRYSARDLERIEVLNVETFSLGIDAYKKEQEILRSFLPDLYKGAPILDGVGHSEIFVRDVLGRDAEARQESISGQQLGFKDE